MGDSFVHQATNPAPPLHADSLEFYSTLAATQLCLTAEKTLSPAIQILFREFN